MDQHQENGAAFRRFGIVGPLYEVLGEAGRRREDERVRIRVVESGEEFDYPVSQMLADPVAS